MSTIERFLDLDMVFNGNASPMLNVEESPRFCSGRSSLFDYELELFWERQLQRCREARKWQFESWWGRPPGEVMQ